jgi:hypothetical protein
VEKYSIGKGYPIGVPHLDRDINCVSILASTPARRLIHQSIWSVRWSYLHAFFTVSLLWKLTWIYTRHYMTNWQTWLNLPRGRKNVPARCSKIHTAMQRAILILPTQTPTKTDCKEDTGQHNDSGQKILFTPHSPPRAFSSNGITASRPSWRF